MKGLADGEKTRLLPAVPPDLVALLLLAFVLRLAAGFLMPNIHWADEIFQVTEPAHRLVFGSGLVTWEWVVGIRSWLLPGVMAGLMWLGSLMGDAPWLINLPIALFLAACACVPVACAYGWGRRAYGRAGAIAAAGVCAVWVDLVSMAPHPLNEVIAANCLLAGLYLGYPDGEDAQPSPRRLFWAGALLGLAFALRFHLGPALAVAALGIAGVRQGWRPWRALLAGAAVPVLGLALLDWVTLGLPLQSVWFNAYLNVIAGVSDQAGTSPFAALLVMPLQVWGPAGFLLVMTGVALGMRRLPLLLLVALTVFVTHSLIPHKEYRFIYPAMPLLAVLAGMGTGRLIHGATSARPALPWLGRALAAGAVVAWAGLSLSIARSDAFSIPWTRGRAQLLAFQAISNDPRLCGVGAYGVPLTLTPGRTWLRPDITLYEASGKTLPAEGRAYNALLAERGVTIHDPAYRRAACFDGDVDASGRPRRQYCVWTRPGHCAAGAAPLPGPIWIDFTRAKRYAPEDGNDR
jgi:hypothetical protein